MQLTLYILVILFAVFVRICLEHIECRQVSFQCDILNGCMVLEKWSSLGEGLLEKLEFNKLLKIRLIVVINWNGILHTATGLKSRI